MRNGMLTPEEAMQAILRGKDIGTVKAAGKPAATPTSTGNGLFPAVPMPPMQRMQMGAVTQMTARTGTKDLPRAGKTLEKKLPTAPVDRGTFSAAKRVLLPRGRDVLPLREEQYFDIDPATVGKSHNDTPFDIDPANVTGQRARPLPKGNWRPAQEDVNWGRVAGGTLVRGADEFVSGMASTAAKLDNLGQKAIGALTGTPDFADFTTGPLEALDEWLQGKKEKNKTFMEPEYKKAGTAGELLEKYGIPTAAAVPQAMMALMTAGSSLAAQGTTKGLQMASTAAKSGLGQSVVNSIQQMAKKPQYWLSFAQTAGNEYEQAKADGADDLEATAYAAISSLVNAAVEVGGGIDTLPQALQGAAQNGKSGLKLWVQGMIDEGKEEVIQGAISQMTQNLTYNAGNPLYSTKDEGAVLSPGRAMEEFMGGAVVGGVLGGGQIGVDAAVNRIGKGLPTARDVARMNEKPASSGETGEYYFDASDTNNSWRDRSYTQDGKTYIQSSDRTRMYEVPRQSEIKFAISQDGTISLHDDVVSQLDTADYRDFIKAYADLNLVTKYDQEGKAVLENKPITVKRTGEKIVITQTGINDVAKKIRGAGIKNSDNVSSILLLDKLIENAIPIETVTNEHGKAAPFTYYNGKLRVGQRDYQVVLHIKNAVEGDRYHYHTLDKIEVGPTYGNPAQGGRYQEMGPTSSNTTIPQGDSGVKIEDMQREREILLPRAGENVTQEKVLPKAEKLSYIKGVIPTDKVQRGIQEAARLMPVAGITGQEFGKGPVDLVTQVSNFFESIGGEVENPQLGMVKLDRSGVGDDIAHGIGRKKAAAFAAVPAVLEHGKVIDYQTNWKERGYDTAVVAAPITIGGEEYLEGIVLTRSNASNRFYVHEVLMAKNNEATPFKTGAPFNEKGLPGGAAPSVISLLSQVADVKRGAIGKDGVQYSAGEDDGYLNGPVKDMEGRGRVRMQGESQEGSAIDRAAKALGDFMEATVEPKKADVMTQMPDGPEFTIGEKLGDGGRDLYRKFVDSGEAVGRIGKELGDKSLYAYYNFARASSNAAGNMLTKGGAQTDVQGRKVGPSLADIFEPIRAKGDEYYRDFETYLFHRHNIDRMSRDNSVAIEQAKFELDDFDEANPDVGKMPESDLMEEAARGDYVAQERLQLLNAYNRAKKVVNKPVFRYDVTAIDSDAQADRLERGHPEFENLAEEVYRYNENLMQYRVDSGLLTKEQADRIQKAYPNYVPTYRLTEGELARELKKGKKVSSAVGRAEGGNSDLMPLHVAMARQTMQVVRNGAINCFGERLLGDYEQNREAGKKYIYEVGRAEYEAHPDYFDQLDDPTPKKENTFTIYRDGDAVQMTVEKGLYEGVQALVPSQRQAGLLEQTATMMNSTFKALVTGYNPMFSARNFFRDLQEAGLYSKDMKAWAESYPLAVHEIATNGAWWRRYQALGGVYSSVFDYQQGYTLGENEHGAVRRQTTDRVEALNMAIEQAPRLAEFMAQAKKHGDNPDAYMDAMLAAATVTTNFGRSGTWGKAINKTAVPFFNPAVQGIDKAARTFLGKKEGKDWLKLIARVAVLGFAPAIINELLNREEPGWDTVRQGDKDVNWLFSIGNGRYIKIPKGRDMSVVVMMADRVGDVMRGEKVDWGETLRTAANQVAPPNPLENNIGSAFMGTDLFDPESPGKTWYGGDIESQRLQGYAPGQRFDENTDVISKTIGGALGISPKKLNYILDQYSGVVGDFVLPILTPSGNKNPLSTVAKAFVLDSVSSNRLSSDFYNKSDEMTYAKNGGDGAMAVVLRFWNRQAGAVSDVYKKIREAENGRELPNAKMLEEVRQDKGVINGIQQNALDVLPAYEEAVRKYYTGDSDQEKDEAYRKANREVFGAEYALQVYNKDVYAKSAECHEEGVSFETYYDAYFTLKEVGGEGKGTSQRKREALVEMEELTTDEKTLLGKYILGDDREMDYSSKASLAVSMMDESSRKKAETVYQYSVSPEVYVAYREKLAQVDTNGSVTQEEAKLALDEMDLTRDQKAALWQLQNTNWKPGKNPYSPSVGSQVISGYQREKDKQEKINLRYRQDESENRGQINLRYRDEEGESTGQNTGEQSAGIDYLPRAGQVQSSGRIILRYR